MICEKSPTAKSIEKITAKNLLVKTGQKLREKWPNVLKMIGNQGKC
jgi:hypothetical protein